MGRRSPGEQAWGQAREEAWGQARDLVAVWAEEEAWARDREIRGVEWAGVLPGREVCRKLTPAGMHLRKLLPVSTRLMTTRRFLKIR